MRDRKDRLASLTSTGRETAKAFRRVYGYGWNLSRTRKFHSISRIPFIANELTMSADDVARVNSVSGPWEARRSCQLLHLKRENQLCDLLWLRYRARISQKPRLLDRVGRMTVRYDTIRYEEKSLTRTQRHLEVRENRKSSSRVIC